MLQVLAGRDVGDDPAMPRMQLGLAVDPLARDPGVRVEDRHRGLVAGALEGQDHLLNSLAAFSTSSAASSCRSSIGANSNRSMNSAGSVISGLSAWRSSLRSSSGVMTTSTWGETPFALIMT